METKTDSGTTGVMLMIGVRIARLRHRVRRFHHEHGDAATLLLGRRSGHSLRCVTVNAEGQSPSAAGGTKCSACTAVNVQTRTKSGKTCDITACKPRQVPCEST